MSRYTTNGALGLGDTRLLGLTHKDNLQPDPLPTAPPFDRAGLELRRATCCHGPTLYDAASGPTCAKCGACLPGSWTWRCLRGYCP